MALLARSSVGAGPPRDTWRRPRSVPHPSVMLLHTVPCGYNAYLAEVEPQLIGVAQAAVPHRLLNKSNVSDDSPIKSIDFDFETSQ